MNKKPAIAITTRTGKIFVNFYNFFFYMYPDGTRFFSKGELKTGKLPTSQEWSWAKQNWENAEVFSLTNDLQKKANTLSKRIKQNDLYGVNDAQLQQITDGRKKKATPNQITEKAINLAGKVKHQKHHIATNSLSDVTGAKKLMTSFKK